MSSRVSSVWASLRLYRAATLDSGGTPAAATIEKIMDRAVQNIARRYNLNESQTRRTDELMKFEVNKFLLEHEDEVWPVIRDLLAAQLGAKPPDAAEERKRIGSAAGPLARLAEDAILRANEEWRKMLSDEQKKMHDFDMAQMEKQFKQINENFEKWAGGERVDGRTDLYAIAARQHARRAQRSWRRALAGLRLRDRQDPRSRRI